MTATYTKLKSGEWGIRVNGTVREGQKVTVRKKDGSEKIETVTKVVWSGNGVSICAVTQYRPKAVKSRGLSDDDRCELCDGNKWTCGHCIGW